MSATASLPDLKSVLADFIERTSKLYISDLSHIPDDKLAVSPMGCARSPIEFSTECGGFNSYVSKVLRGESPEVPSPESRARFYSSIDTREKVVEYLEKNSRELVDAINAATEESLAREITAPWGQPMPTYTLVHMAGNHMSYHDGQLNYIQCLYGDSDNHWG